MLIAADQIINHAALLPKMSGGRVKLPIIFRTIKASLNDKFWVGHQHSKDFTYIFKPHITTYELPRYHAAARAAYRRAYNEQKPTLVVEDYASFDEEVK